MWQRRRIVVHMLNSRMHRSLAKEEHDVVPMRNMTSRGFAPLRTSLHRTSWRAPSTAAPQAPSGAPCARLRRPPAPAQPAARRAPHARARTWRPPPRSPRRSSRRAPPSARWRGARRAARLLVVVSTDDNAMAQCLCRVGRCRRRAHDKRWVVGRRSTIRAVWPTRRSLLAVD